MDRATSQVLPYGMDIAFEGIIAMSGYPLEKQIQSNFIDMKELQR
jgi:hypothetical protein